MTGDSTAPPLAGVSATGGATGLPLAGVSATGPPLAGLSVVEVAP